MKLKIFVNEGSIIPPWYGLSYQRYMTHDIVCHLVPINLFVRLFKRIEWAWWKTVKNPGGETKREKALQEAFEEGVSRNKPPLGKSPFIPKTKIEQILTQYQDVLEKANELVAAQTDKTGTSLSRYENAFKALSTSLVTMSKIFPNE